MTIFETDRLEVREMINQDFVFFTELLSDPEIIEPIPQPKWSEEDIKNKFLDFTNYSVDPLLKDKVICGVCEKGKDELIGLCDFLTNDETMYEV